MGRADRTWLYHHGGAVWAIVLGGTIRKLIHDGSAFLFDAVVCRAADAVDVPCQSTATGCVLHDGCVWRTAGSLLFRTGNWWPRALRRNCHSGSSDSQRMVGYLCQAASP